MAAPYRSAQKLRRDNCLSEITSNATLKATALANLGLAGASVGSNYTTTATAAGSTTLTATSTREQFFTGSTTQTVVLPVASTMKLGQDFLITNASSGAVTVNSSGANAVVVIAAGTSADVTCVKITGTDATSWNAEYAGEVISSAKLLTVTNTLTLSGTDATVMTFPNASDTVAGLAASQTFTNKTIDTAGNNAIKIAGTALSSVNGSGAVVLTTGPVLVTPTLGAASATTLAITGVTAGAVNLGDGAVTQGTGNTTTVVSNTASGVITSFGAYSTAGASVATAFTVTCSACAATSAVIGRIVSYTGTFATNGLPHVYVGSISAGSFTLQVANLHAANALSGTIKFAYAVL